jgi:hypothetical protein
MGTPAEIGVAIIVFFLECRQAFVVAADDGQFPLSFAV